MKENVMKTVADGKLKFNNLTKYYSDYVFKFIKNYYKYLNTNMKIIDIGCGHGRNLNLFEKLGFKNLIGIDIIKRCKINEFKFIEADITEKIPIDNQLGDIVLFNFVLMFICQSRQEHVIKELIRITKEYLIIETRKTKYKNSLYQHEYDVENLFLYFKNQPDMQILDFNIKNEKILLRRKFNA